MDRECAWIETDEHAQSPYLPATLESTLSETEFEALARAHFRHHGRRGYQVVISLDGKAVRGTIATEGDQGLWLLAVFLPGEGVTLAQLAIESQHNEISAAPTLLEYVDLRDNVVIGDALHTQKGAFKPDRQGRWQLSVDGEGQRPRAPSGSRRLV
jgi:hypothetical protein